MKKIVLLTAVSLLMSANSFAAELASSKTSNLNTSKCFFNEARQVFQKLNSKGELELILLSDAVRNEECPKKRDYSKIKESYFHIAEKSTTVKGHDLASKNGLDILTETEYLMASNPPSICGFFNRARITEQHTVFKKYGSKNEELIFILKGKGTNKCIESLKTRVFMDIPNLISNHYVDADGTIVHTMSGVNEDKRLPFQLCKELTEEDRVFADMWTKGIVSQKELDERLDFVVYRNLDKNCVDQIVPNLR